MAFRKYRASGARPVDKSIADLIGMLKGVKLASTTDIYSRGWSVVAG